MRYYTKQHSFYCGIDLHARSMYVCIVDQNGKTLFHENMAVNADLLEQAVAPCIPDIAISVECIFTWYWIADFFLLLKPLSLLFRRLFREALQQSDLYEQVPKSVWRADWVCHIKPVGDGSAALKYLAPYIMRVALSDKNILSLKNGMVT